MKPNDQLFCNPTQSGVQSNLTVRDHVAIEMAKGLIASGRVYTPEPNGVRAVNEKIAADAFWVADALITESQK